MKYERAEVLRSAIMQDFQDNEEKNLKWPTGGHFGFYQGEICHGSSLCETFHLFYIHGPAILHFFQSLKYHKITQIQNGR